MSGCFQALLGYLTKASSSLKQKRQKRAIAMFLLTLAQESPSMSVVNRLYAVEAIGETGSSLFDTIPSKAIQVAKRILKDEKASLAYQRKAQIFLSKNQKKKRKPNNKFRNV